MNISEILSKYDTDKNREHHYGDAYDYLFRNFDRNAKLNILEIGTQKGESLLAWRECFPNARITGIDIVDLVPNKRDDINYVVMDVNDYKTDEMFDIVIDDGSHWLKDIFHTTLYFSSHLKSGGLIVIEDVQKPKLWVEVIVDILNPYLDYNFNKELQISHNDIRESSRPDDFLIVIKNVHENKVSR